MIGVDCNRPLPILMINNVLMNLFCCLDAAMHHVALILGAVVYLILVAIRKYLN